MTREQIIHARKLIYGEFGLMSTDCECGREKPARKSFCLSCWKGLPGEVKAGLYKRMGKGYEEAHAQARAILKGNR